MPLPLRTVNFDISQFTGAEFGLGETFLVIKPTLSTTVDGEIVPAIEVRFAPTGTGTGTFQAVPGQLGVPEFDYTATLLRRTDGGISPYEALDLGRFRVPTGAGPFVLGALIAEGAPVVGPEGWYKLTAGEFNAIVQSATNSASAAAGSATAAAGSATAAATSATNAANSATASSGSATASANSATNSANSATASANSATLSASSAAQSATSATNSANSATASAASASSANASAASSANSAADASAFAVAAAANGNTFPSVADGIAGVADGAVFFVPVSGGNGLIIYERDGAAANVIGHMHSDNFASRAQLILARPTMLNPVGTTVFANGLAYRLEPIVFIGIPDAPGLSPINPTPLHYGDNTTPGTTDMSDALELWLSSNPGKEVFLPAGTYRATRMITGAPLRITGRGDIVWDAGVSGIRIVATSAQPFEIDGVGLFTKGVGTGTALEIDYSGLIGDTGVIVPRASTHIRTRDLRIAGAAALTASTAPFTIDGWAFGVVANSALGMDMSGGRINGLYTDGYGSTPTALVAVWFKGDGSPTQLKIDRVDMSSWQDAVLTNDAEGIYITSCGFVTVMRGVRCASTVNESGFHFIGNHVAALDACLDLSQMSDFVIKGNNLYNAGGDVTSWPATMDAVRLGTGTGRGRIEGNLFTRIGTTTAYTSVRINGGTGIEVGPNNHQIGSTNLAVVIEAAASNCRVERQNTTSASNTPYVNNSTTTTFEEFRNYLGSLNSIFLSSRASQQLHMLATGCTDGPAGVGTGGAALLTYCFNADTASRHFFPANSDIAFTQRRRAGAWGVWERTSEVIGSNGNGQYKISPKGILQCWHQFNITSVVNTVVSVDWTFPFPAIDSASRVFTNVPTTALGSVFNSASAITTTEAQINLRRNDSAVSTSVQVHMIGKAF